jgi:hypothetical protein
MQITCPQCKHVLHADNPPVGAMLLCQNCLVLFPTPRLAPEFPPLPSLAMAPEPELDLRLIVKPVANEAAWRLVYVGLGLVQFGTIVMLALGALVAALILIDFTQNRFFIARGFILMVPGIPFCGGLVCAFIGVCLCWNVPGKDLQSRLRVSIVLFVLAALLQGVIWGLHALLDGWEFRQAAAYLGEMIIVIDLAVAFIFWITFLQRLAQTFERIDISWHIGNFLAAGILFVPSVLCCGVFSSDFARGGVLCFAFFLAAASSAFLLWHIRLVGRLRFLLPVRIPPTH